MLNGHDTDRALSALQHLDPNCDRATWVRTGMAFHAAGGDFDSFDQWSAQADSYRANDCRDTWRSFKPGKGIGAGALFGMARDHGWTEGRPAPAMNFDALLKPARKPQEPPRKPAPGMSASEVFARALPATAGHEYVKAKRATGVPIDDLRVMPEGDPLRIMGESMAGALVLPVRRADGSLSTLQFITAGATAQRLKAAGKTTKPNLPGHSVEGWHTVGTPKPGEPLYLCEGIGTAWAAWVATGAAAVVCFGWGNVSKVATALRQRDARLVLCPDTGKEQDADRIAAEVGAAVARMPEGWPDNSDLNDLFQREGFDVVAALLEGASEPPKPEPLLKPVSVTDVWTNPSPAPAFAWDGYCPLSEVTLFAANGGTGKSVIGLMLAVSAALGRPLFDVPTRHCRVLFASLEDGADLVRHRVANICRAWGIDPLALADRLVIVDGTEHPELFSVDTRGAGDATPSYGELCRLAAGAGLVVVDNASDAFGGDEIKRREVRAFVRVLKHIAKAQACAVVLLAHVNATTARARKPTDDEGYSGSTAWNNSVRSRLFLSRDEMGLLTLAHQKANLSKRREPITLQWLDDGLPQLVQGGGFDDDGFSSRQQGRADDDAAAALLRLLAEFEGRGQYCHTGATSRSNPYAILRSEPGFQKLKLDSNSTKRVITQCQRAKWIEPLDYRTLDRKLHQRWTLTTLGR